MAGYARNHDAMKVGLFALTSVTLFAALFGFMTNRSLTSVHTDLFLRFPSADGLKKGDAVLFHGVQVGEVKTLRFEEAGGVLVRARLTEVVPLRSGATGELVAADIFGRQSVVLRQGLGGAIMTAADTLTGPAPSSLTAAIGELGERAGRLLGDTTLALLRDALGGVALATEDIGSLSNAAERAIIQQRDGFTAAARAAERLAGNLDAAADPEDLARIRTGLAASAGSLAQATARLDTASYTLVRVLAGIEAGEGTAGRLLNDPLLYDRVASVLTSLEALLEDLRKNPKRYVNVRVF